LIDGVFVIVLLFSSFNFLSDLGSDFFLGGKF
jgi:hypothetical protein